MSALALEYNLQNISSTSKIATLDLYRHAYLSYQVNVTGSLIGALQLWVSNDNINFVQRPESSLSIPAPGPYMVEITTPCTARYYKLVMYVGAGTGSVDTFICIKGDV